MSLGLLSARADEVMPVLGVSGVWPAMPLPIGMALFIVAAASTFAWALTMGLLLVAFVPWCLG